MHEPSHAVRCLGLPIHQAAIAAATTPATALGPGQQTGSLHPGKDADLVVPGEQLDVHAVLARGALTHGALS